MWVLLTPLTCCPPNLILLLISSLSLINIGILQDSILSFLPEVESGYVIILNSFIRKICSFSPFYLYNHSCIYINMDSCIFILYLELSSSTMSFIFLHKLSQLWPLEAFFGWLLCPFAMAPSFFFFYETLILWHYNSFIYFVF